MTNIIYYLSNFSGSKDHVSLDPYYGPIWTGSIGETADPIVAYPDATGTVTFNNVIPNTYIATVHTPDSELEFIVEVAANLGTVNMKDLPISAPRIGGKLVFPNTASWAMNAKFCQTASYALNASGVITASMSPEGHKIYVDQVYGTATASPYNSCSLAKAAAVAGDLIVVRPGTYHENNLLKNGVNWHFEDGAIVDYTAPRLGSGSNSQQFGIFDDRYTGAATSSISGEGVFLVNAQDNTNVLGTFVSTTGSSFMRWKGKDVGYSLFPDVSILHGIGSRAALYGKHGTIFAEFDRIYDPLLGEVLHTGQYDIDDEITFPNNASGIYWELGEMYVKFKLMTKMSSYQIWGNQPTGNTASYNMYYEGDLIDGSPQSTIYMDGVGTYNWRTWGNVKEIRNTICNLFEHGRHYLRFEKLSANNNAFSIPYGCQVWISGQKLSSGKPFLTINDDSEVTFDIDEYEDITPDQSIGAIWNLSNNSGSKLHLRGGFVKSSGPCIEHWGGSTYVRGMTLENSMSTSPSPTVLVHGPGLFLESCFISASAASNYSVSGSAATTITAHGSNANKIVSPNITVLGRPIGIDNVPLTASLANTASIALALGNNVNITASGVQTNYITASSATIVSLSAGSANISTFTLGNGSVTNLSPTRIVNAVEFTDHPTFDLGLVVTGSITASVVTSSFIGRLTGTASYADTAGLAPNYVLKTGSEITGPIEFKAGSTLLMDAASNGIQFTGATAADFTIGTFANDVLQISSRNAAAIIFISGSTFYSASLQGTASYANTASVVTKNSYTIPTLMLTSLSPSSGTTYYIGAGGLTTGTNTDYNSQSLYVSRAGTIKAAALKVHWTTAATSGEFVTHSLFVNNSTAVSLQSRAYNSTGATEITGSNLSTAVAAGDSLAFRVQTPTWSGGGPLNMRAFGYVYIE